MPFRGIHMKRVSIVLAAASLLAGCEDLQDQMFGEAVTDEPPPEQSPETPSPEFEPSPELAERPESPPPAVPLPPTPPVSPPPAPPPVQPPVPPTGPLQPVAAPELLAYVDNWRAIPKTLFPRQLTVNRQVQFVLRDRTGNSIGGSTYPSGSKLIAFEQVGGMVSVGPSETSPMRTLVGLAETDLKMVLIYAYEMAKYHRAQIASAHPPRPVPVAPVGETSVPPSPRPPVVNRPVSGAKPTPKANPTPRPGRQPKPKRNDSLFEDLPEPKDLGHGKWCVCKNCRSRRGAGRGGVLYPDQ